MPNPIAITLRASAAATAGGTGTSVDLGDRTYVQLTLDVTAFTTGPLVVYVDTSLLGGEWVAAGQFEAVGGVVNRTLTVPAAGRWLRVRWTLSAGSVTFAVTGTAHQLYALPADVTRYGVPAAALDGVPLTAVADACLSASDEAAGYLSSAYTLPLTAWDIGTRKHVSAMAAYDLMRFRGYDPDSGKDELLQRGRDQAVQWLNRIADGKLRPVGIVDSTPTVAEPEVYVESAASRGWRR